MALYACSLKKLICHNDRSSGNGRSRILFERYEFQKTGSIPPIANITKKPKIQEQGQRAGEAASGTIVPLKDLIWSTFEDLFGVVISLLSGVASGGRSNRDVICIFRLPGHIRRCRLRRNTNSPEHYIKKKVNETIEVTKWS